MRIATTHGAISNKGKIMLATVRAIIQPGFGMIHILGLDPIRARDTKIRLMRASETLQLPFSRQDIYVRIDPVSVPKETNDLDFAIIMAIYAISGVIKPELIEDKLFCGQVRPTARLEYPRIDDGALYEFAKFFDYSLQMRMENDDLLWFLDKWATNLPRRKSRYA